MRVFMVALLLMAGPVFGQERHEERLFATIQADIRHTEGYTRMKGKERERVDNVLRHLSDFDSQYQRGKFDKGKLDEAIDDLKNLAENNAMSSEDRRLLMDDLGRLREFRARRG